jgi:cytochrome c553
MNRLYGCCLVIVCLLVPGWASADASEWADLVNQRYGCGKCHGARGVSRDPWTPNLAGQDRTYIVRQLRLFSGRHSRPSEDPDAPERSHALMEGVTAHLDDQAKARIADHYASLRCVSAAKAPVSPPPPYGRTCVACHGPGGVNIEPGVPDLAGQQPKYLEEQIRSFQRSFVGTAELDPEKERYDPIMAGHAVYLNGAQIRGLAAFFNGSRCRP